MSPAVAVHSRQLEALITRRKRSELECRAYLRHAVNLLVPDPFATFYKDEHEMPGNTGRVDYFIACKIHDREPTIVRCWLWELKAPQCPMFRLENKNRLCPTMDLVEAENQLLYYYEERRRNPHFREKLGIRYEDDIKLGGVIIGRDRFVQNAGGLSADTLNELWYDALRMRETYFYRHHHMSLFTWERVLRHMTSGHVHSGDLPSRPQRKRA